MTLVLDDILCLHCKHNLELSKGQIGDGDEFAALVRCGRDGWYKHLRTNCPGYKADCLKQQEPCNGDCEKCRTRTEWKEWSE